MSQAKATAFLDLNIKGFEQAISTAKKLLVGLAGAFAAFKTIDFFKNGITDAIKFGDEMYHLSDRLGIAAGDMFVMQQAAQKATGSATAFQEMMEEAYSSGRSIAEMWQSTDKPGWVSGEYAEALRKAQLEYGKTGEILNRSAERFSKLQDLVNLVGSKLREVFLMMAERFIKPLNAALRFFASIDFSATAKKFGDMINKAILAITGLIKDGNLFKAIGLGFSLMVDKMVMLLLKGFQKVVPILIHMGTELVKGIMAGLEDDKTMKAFRILAKTDGPSKFQGSQPAAYYKSEKAKEKMMEQLGTSSNSIAWDELMKKSIESGTKALLPYLDDGRKERVRWAAMGKQDPYSVIADSIQSQGGGGAYITSGLSIEAKEAMRQTAVAKENRDYNKAAVENLRIMTRQVPVIESLVKGLKLGQ